jgi:uncharacterized protein
MASEQQRRRQAVLLGMSFEGSFVLLAWLLGWLVGESPIEHWRWSRGDVTLGLAASLPLLVLFLAFFHWPVGPLRRIKDFLEEIFKPLFRPCTTLDLAILSVLAGAGEEMLFRGVLQGAFSRWLGVPGGLILASILFGLAHAITATYAIIAALVGLYFGWLWLVTDNLLTPIVCHAAYDFVALVYILRNPSASDVVPARRPSAKLDDEIQP